MAAGTPLLSGPWTIHLLADEREVPFHGTWEWCCFHTDADGDYLELEATGLDGWRIERQIFLGRRSHRLLLAETVCAPASVRELGLDSRIPLAEGITATFDRATREGRLSTSRPTRRFARLFPLALEQDRIQKAWGACETCEAEAESPAGISLFMNGSARGLYSPLILDWHPDRRTGAPQWRTLTCSQEGRKLTPSEAAGHRLRLGDEQWLVYRQVERSEVGRCVLGYHTRYESVVGQVGPDGTIRELLQIE